MTDQPKRKSALSRASQRDLGARSIEQFVARANEELSAVATAQTLETREAYEEKLRLDVEELQARHASEVEQLQARLARGRTRGRVMIIGGFLLGAAVMFVIDLARAPSRTPVSEPAAVDPTPPTTPAPPPAPASAPPVAPPAAAPEPPAAAAAPSAPSVATRPPKQAPTAKPVSARPKTPPPKTPPPPPPEDLVNPF